MKQKLLPLLLALSLLLTGCGWMDGRYSSVTPHLEQRQDTQPEVIVASDYLDLMDALEEMIQSGSESGVINVADYPADAVENGMGIAVKYATEAYPVGAYAVDRIDYEVGANGGLPAVGCPAGCYPCPPPPATAPWRYGRSGRSPTAGKRQRRSSRH